MRISKGGTFLFSVDPKNYDKVANLYLNGNTVEKLTKKFNCSRMTIQRILIKMNVQHRWNRKSFVQDNFFSKIDSEIPAYILGFLYADGYNNEKMGCLEVALQKRDGSFLKQIASHLTKKSLYENEDVFRLSIYSKQISLDLKRLGCPQAKSLILKFPSSMQVPTSLLQHFMRGYFDGDGCIYSGGNIQSFDICGTLLFLEKFREILQRNVGIVYVGNIRKVNNIYRWRISNKQDIRKIANFFYDGATLFLERKRTKMLSIQ
jgi:intein-encoded DNA endonuclease-like protein